MLHLEYFCHQLTVASQLCRQVYSSLACFVQETGMFLHLLEALASLWHFTAPKSLQWSYMFSASAEIITEMDLFFLWFLLSPFHIWCMILWLIFDQVLCQGLWTIKFWIEVLDKKTVCEYLYGQGHSSREKLNVCWLLTMTEHYLLLKYMLLQVRYHSLDFSLERCLSRALSLSEEVLRMGLSVMDRGLLRPKPLKIHFCLWKQKT